MSNSIDPNLYGIHRVGPGWQVTLIRQFVPYSRYFGSKRYGDDASALVAAKAWRDKMSVQTPAMSLARFSAIVKRHNTSGCPGVNLKRQRRKEDGSEWVYWHAITPRGVKPARTKCFGVNRYGYEQAYALAVQARDEFLREIEARQLLRYVPHHLQPVESAHLEDLARLEADARNANAGRPRKKPNRDTAPGTSFR